MDIAKTADGEDYKLVAERIPRIQPKKRTPPKLANPKEDIPYIVEDIVTGLEDAFNMTSSDRSKKTFSLLAAWYGRNMLYQALSIVKADLRGKIKQSSTKAFMYQVHVMAHERNMPWISDCGAECRYRAGNRTPLFKK